MNILCTESVCYLLLCDIQRKHITPITAVLLPFVTYLLTLPHKTVSVTKYNNAFNEDLHIRDQVTSPAS
jgi:hypothetical protein